MLPLIGNVDEYFVLAEYFAPGQEAPGPEAAAVEVPPAPPNSPAPGPPGPPGPAAPVPPDMPEPDPELPAAVPGVPDLPPGAPQLMDWELPLYRAWSSHGGSTRGGRYWTRRMARKDVVRGKK